MTQLALEDNAAQGQPTKAMRIGAIGIDSSHLPEFTSRINVLNEQGLTTPRVTAFYDPGNHQLPASDVDQWREKTLSMGTVEVPSMEELLEQVDGVMILSVDGKAHARLAMPALERGLPTYIDKPMTCSVEHALGLLAAARQSGARCYSASSLRFAAEIQKLNRPQLGELLAIDAFGPGQLNAATPGLFYYGVHTIEMVDAIWGPGVGRIRAIHTPDRDLVDLEYRDGRVAHLRLERKGAYEFGATVHGLGGATQFKVDFADVYNQLIRGMVGFFEGKAAPVSMRDTVENIAVMQAGNQSLAADGKWMDVPQIT